MIRGRLGKLHDAGAMGASRAVRARVARELTFDEMLGPGAPLHAAEDIDFSYRALKAGWWIAHAPDAAVLHWGYRGFKEGSQLMWNISGGIAASYVKHMRSRDAAAVLLFAHEAWRTVENLFHRIVRLERPFGFRRVAGFIAGTIVAAHLPIDGRAGLYRPHVFDAPGVGGGATAKPMRRSESG